MEFILYRIALGILSIKAWPLLTCSFAIKIIPPKKRDPRLRMRLSSILQVPHTHIAHVYQNHTAGSHVLHYASFNCILPAAHPGPSGSHNIENQQKYVINSNIYPSMQNKLHGHQHGKLNPSANKIPMPRNKA